MDTGSDLIWTQCASCIRCYHQDRPLYDSTKSSTYNIVMCDEPLGRQTLSENNCSSNNCKYSTLYADCSTSRGTLATEKFNFQMVVDGGHVAATSTRLVFGCGQENNLLFSGGGTSGILGLGAEVLSLISQLGSNMERRFSYCLPKSVDYTGYLKLGLKAGISGGGVVSTPLLKDERYPTYYYVSLEGITVGGNGKKIAYKQVSSGKGNTIVDSGSTLNYIDPELYYDLISTLKDVIGLQTVEDPELYYSLCYSTETFNKIPEQTLIFHFSGADMELKNINMFIPVHDMICFSMTSSQRASYNLYGSIAQKDFEVDYNLESKVASFALANCSQYSQARGLEPDLHSSSSFYFRVFYTYFRSCIQS